MMASITKLKPADPIRHIEAGVALSLLQAIHRHLEPEAVINVLWNQAASLVQASGLHYRHPGRGLDIGFGRGGHTASYGLSDNGQPLGELVVRFERPASEPTLATAEDLIALAVPAIRNALAYDEMCQRTAAAPAPGTLAVPAQGPDEHPGAAVSAGGDAEAGDALVLVRLDGFDAIAARHGSAWAQTLLQSVQHQIHEGLRDADSVFQIDEGLLAVLLPHTTPDAALDVAAKIRVLVAGLHLRDGRITSQLTACMGIAGAGSAASPDQVLEQARAALADAEREGENNIRAWRVMK